MGNIKHFISVCILVFTGGLYLQVEAQEISVYQYRHVEQEDLAEFIDRETTYWSKVAEHAMNKGNLTFWALLVKQGGYDIPNSSNVLFINTYKNIDEMAGTWDPSEVFPDVPMENMSTGSMSTVMHTLFVRAEEWVQVKDAVPEEQFNYVTVVYHDTDAPGDLIALENEHWGPFIKSAMDNGHTSQKAWGNATILSPSGPQMGASTISFDIYATAKDALAGTISEEAELPEEGLNAIIELENGPRTSYLYQIAGVVDANAME